MSAPDLLIHTHQLAQIDNGVLAAVMATELFTEFRRGGLGREDLVTALVGADLLAHNAAVALARRFVADLRDAEGVDGEFVDATFDVGASFGRAAGTLSDLDQARVRLPVERDFNAEFWRMVEGFAVRADRAAKMAGRETVMASAEASGRSWRRVSDGNPCSFCAMLVARGDAYTSETAALTVVGRGTDTSVNRRADGRRRRGGQAKGVKPRGTRGLGEKFHNHCGCTVVEQIGSWTPTAEEQRYIDLYNANAGGDASEVLARMRAEGHGIINDAHKPKTQTGGSGGGGQPPRKPRPVRGGPDEPEWARRQAALKSDTSSERLEPHEIEFLERFEALGHLAKWIPTGRFVPTNDFVWVERGTPFELKTTQARHATIHGRIVDAASRASRHGVVKENFVIDLGDEPLTKELREELGSFNVGRRSYRLRELWVMTKGELLQIHLAS